MTNSRPRLRFYINLAGLASGFVLGQGTFLIVSTWLVAAGNYPLLTATTLSMNFFAILLQTADLGGNVVLSRARLRAGHHDGQSFQSILSAMFICRLLSLALTLLLSLAYLALSVRVGTDLFGPGALLGAGPGLAFWCLNQQGRLDAIRKTSAIGIASALPWLAVCAGIFISRLSAEGFYSGFYFGLYYSLGTAAVVAVNYIELWRAGERTRFRAPSVRRLRHTAKNGVAILFAWLPGQLSGRIQMAIAGFFLPAAVAGLFVYARNLLNAGNNVSFLIRRLEFPQVVEAMKAKAQRLDAIRLAFIKHRLSLAFSSAVCVAGLATFGLRLVDMSEGSLQRLAEAAIIVGMLSPFFFTASIAGAFAQVLQAAGRPTAILSVNYLSLAAGVAVSLALVTTLGLWALVAGTAVTALIQLYGYSIALKRIGASRP